MRFRSYFKMYHWKWDNPRSKCPPLLVKLSWNIAWICNQCFPWMKPSCPTRAQGNSAGLQLRECWAPGPVFSPQFTQLPREEKEKEEGSRERMAQVFLPHFSCLRTCFFSVEIQKVSYFLQWTLKCSILDTVFILIHMLGVGLVNLNGNIHFSIARGTQISPLGSYKLEVVENASPASSPQPQNPGPH